MDSYREHPSDFDLGGAAETTASHDVAAAIGTDERRMHVRAYNHWVSLLDGRDFPSIEDLEPARSAVWPRTRGPSRMSRAARSCRA
jgi:hypothetical protein